MARPASITCSRARSRTSIRATRRCAASTARGARVGTRTACRSSTQIEKELGIFDKKRIEQEVGIAKFTALCRASVMRHVAEWEAMTERMGFWVDFKQAYFTLTTTTSRRVW